MNQTPIIQLPYQVYLFVIAEVVLHLAFVWLGLVVRACSNSWRLFRRYSVLLPSFFVYAWYFFHPIDFSADIATRIYLCALYGLALVGPAMVLVDWKIFQWALGRRKTAPPRPQGFTKGDFVIMVVPAVMLSTLCWFLFKDLALLLTWLYSEGG